MKDIRLRMLGVAAAYFVIGKLSLLLAIPPGYAAAVWPPSGIALAAVLLWGQRIWPGIVIGSFAMEPLLTQGVPEGSGALVLLAVSLGIGFGAALQAVAGAALIRRISTSDLLSMPGARLVRSLLMAGPLACLINSSLGVLLLVSAGRIPGAAVFLNGVTWWVGDSLGVVVGAPLTLILMSRSGRKQRVHTALPLLLVLTGAVAMYEGALDWERKIQRESFEAKARQGAHDVEHAWARHSEAVLGLQSFVLSSGDLRAVNFSTFARGILSRSGGLQALEWIPLVRLEERAEFEARMSREGQGAYRILELDSEGARAPAGPRPWYLPIAYAEPHAGNERALGFDLASQADRSGALMLAGMSGRLAATQRLRLVQEHERSFGLILAAPVAASSASVAENPPLEGRVRGFVVGVLRMDDFVHQALGTSGLGGIDLEIHDLWAANGGRVLWSSGASEGREILYRREMDAGGRPWELRFSAKAPLLSGPPSWRLWTVLVGGFGLSAVLGLFLLVSAGRQLETEQAASGYLSDLQALRKFQEAEQTLAAARMRREREAQKARGQTDKVQALGRLAHAVEAEFGDWVADLQLLQREEGAGALRLQELLQRGEGLRRQLLDLGVPAQGALETVDLNRLLDDLLPGLRKRFGEAAVVRMAGVPASELRVLISRQDAQEAIQKLAGWTWDGIQSGIRLSTGECEEEGKSWGFVRLEFESAPASFSEDPRIFEPSFPPDPEGLHAAGLLLSRAGGRMQVEALDAGGVGVTLCFLRDLAPILKASTGNEVILVVEENTSLLKLTVRVLQSKGYQVIAAKSLEDALEQVRAPGTRVDLVLTELRMKAMDGPQLVRELRGLIPGLRAAFMCQQVAEILRHLGTPDSGIQLLEKPFGAADLLRVVRQALDHGARRQAPRL